MSHDSFSLNSFVFLTQNFNKSRHIKIRLNNSQQLPIRLCKITLDTKNVRSLLLFRALQNLPLSELALRFSLCTSSSSCLQYVQQWQQQQMGGKRGVIYPSSSSLMCAIQLVSPFHSVKQEDREENYSMHLWSQSLSIVLLTQYQPTSQESGFASFGKKKMNDDEERLVESKGLSNKVQTPCDVTVTEEHRGEQRDVQTSGT